MKSSRKKTAGKTRASSSRRKRKTSASSRTGARKATRKTARKAAPRRTRRTPSRPARSTPLAPAKTPRLDRERRILTEEHEAHGLPSSLDLERHGSSVRTGRDELKEKRRDHATLTPGITAGDPDVDVEQAYFSGESAPGGDNPTPDQDVVDEIGEALGLQYQDNEELRSGEKLNERDRHRWEFDPASSEDYRDRKNGK
ncbi:MAG: DUF6335 family protein [Vicinamibacterales bacterium]